MIDHLARPVCPHACDSDSARVSASPPYTCSSPPHANRSAGQRNTTQSSLCSPALNARMRDSDNACVTISSSLFPCGAFSTCPAFSPFFLRT